jgi:hypothetical protein
LYACFSNELAPTNWPPVDFTCEVEEVALRDGVLQVVRRVRFDGDGTVTYGLASTSCVDVATGVALPVFDRLAIYRLVPVSIRAFARSLNRLGVTTIDGVQGERGVASSSGLVLRWRAFGASRSIVARGRVHGPMAEILSVVMAHLPSGERFGLPGAAERVVVPVLRGVPAPLAQVDAALAAHEDLLLRRGDDRALLLDAFALACAVGARSRAEALLQRWTAAGGGAPQGPFPDATEGGLKVEVLQRLLPPQ